VCGAGDFLPTKTCSLGKLVSEQKRGRRKRGSRSRKEKRGGRKKRRKRRIERKKVEEKEKGRGTS
jgi:hypothetical protein